MDAQSNIVQNVFKKIESNLIVIDDAYEPKIKTRNTLSACRQKKKRIIELASGMPSRAVNGKMFHAFLAAAVADFTRCSNAKVEPNKHQKIIKI